MQAFFCSHKRMLKYITIFVRLIGTIPMAVFNIALGLLCGSFLGVKQVGGICGALLTNVAAWLSGIWFDLKLVGGVFEDIAYVLPFVHAVELERAVILGDLAGALPHLYPVAGFALVVLIGAIVLFLRQMTKWHLVQFLHFRAQVIIITARRQSRFSELMQQMLQKI